MLAQAIALISYGNQWLIADKRPADLDMTNPVFRFCWLLDFVDVQGDGENRLTRHPPHWFGWLKGHGCQRLRLYYRPADENAPGQERQLTTLAGGDAIWFIEAVHAGYSDYWSIRWKKSDYDDIKIWGVTYGRTNVNFATTEMQLDLQETAATLDAALRAIGAFASRQGLADWEAEFKRALDRLHSDSQKTGYYHEDPGIAANYSLTARRLLNAAATAWIFEDPGSWEELVFENPGDNQRYDAVSSALYDAINRSILAATNSF